MSQTESGGRTGALLDTAETSSVSVVRTVKTPLETSRRKDERLQSVIDTWQDILHELSLRWPSLDYHQQTNRFAMTPYYWLETAFPDVFEQNEMYKHTASEAKMKIAESYESWRQNGHDGKRPHFDGDGDWMRTRGKYIDLVSNDRGYGLKVKLKPYSDPEWWHCQTSAYHEQYFDRVIDGDARLGASELRYDDDGQLFAHLVITTDVECYEPDTISRFLGVDVGERNIYTSAVIDGDGVSNPYFGRDALTVEDVHVESGGEFRHRREQITEQRKRLQEANRYQQVLELRNKRERYTEHVLHRCSRQIVDQAVAHEPCGIVLEDLTHIRQQVTDPIHDMPFASLQEKIMYKATEAGVPVIDIHPANTSTTCRQCGTHDPDSRQDARFVCTACGYNVDADVNAAVNIARRGALDER